MPFNSLIKICLTTFLLIACTPIQPDKTDDLIEHELALKHNLREIHIMLTKYDLGVAHPAFRERSSFYDSAGFKYREISYTESGLIDTDARIDYDSRGNRIQTTGLDADGSLQFQIHQTFNNKNQCLQQTATLSDGSLKYKNLATYDASGKMKRLDWTRPTGLKVSYIYSYDAGKPVQMKEMASEGPLNYTIDYEYDKSGKLIRSNQYFPESSQTIEKLFEYNSIGNKIRETYLESGRTINYIKYEYDSLTGLLQNVRTFDSKDRLLESKIYQYIRFEKK